ncbi:MAG: SUMF1/EgtB/PvdO family nonheme iron enzyme [Blastocatellia bacterium]|nr:SUMF1/EgtB/PvdO family nonheme iron enzyme [Blastocatellia bacterium]
MNWKRMIAISLLVWLLALPWLSRAQQRGQVVRPAPVGGAGRYHALLIAVQKYRDPKVNPLDHPIRDAEQVREALTTAYRFERADVSLLKDPDREALLGALDEFAERLRPEDRLLVFYAGHGHWDEARKQGYWLPSDAQKGNRANWISNSDIRDAIKPIRARHVLLISDACFSGSLFVTRDAFSRAAAAGEVDKLPSRTAMTSGALTTVPDRSVFVNYLLKKLRENDEPYLLAGDLFGQLRTPVINNSRPQPDGSLPTPRYGVIQEAGDEGGEFVFLRRMSGAPPPVTTSNPPPRIEEKPPSPFRNTSFTTGTLVENELKTRQAECEVYVEDLGGGVTIELALVRGGRFPMGSPQDEAGRANDEDPQHKVTVGKFWMGRYEVTQRQWRAVAAFPKVRIDLNADPSRFKGDKLPVENISWDEAKEFIARLNRKLGLTEQTGYRLPSEAEWEYAARAGTTTPFAFGATITPEIVNYNGDYPYGGATKGTYRKQTVDIGSLGVANAFGLFDMHGNVWEWCEDDWHAHYDKNATKAGRPWIDRPDRGSLRVSRGGGWGNNGDNCRSARRLGFEPGNRGQHLGFRLLRTYR